MSKPMQDNFVKPTFQECLDLLPGFKELNNQIAQEYYGRIASFQYRKAEARDPSSGHITEKLYGIGFLEIKHHDNLGTVLISKELRRAYIFDASTDKSRYAENFAKILMVLAGWRESPSIEYRDRTPGEKSISYYQIGREIEKEYQAATQAVSLKDSETQLCFVDEAISYYERQTDIHSKNILIAAQAEREDEADAHYNHARYTSHIKNNLSKCKEFGIALLKMPKAKPENYLQAWGILTGIMKVKGVEITALGIEIPKEQPNKEQEQPEDTDSGTVPSYSVDELLAYYERMSELHQKATYSAARLGRDNDADIQNDYARQTFDINFNLKECKKAGIEILKMPKATPKDYRQAWESLTGAMKEKGIKISALGMEFPKEQQKNEQQQQEQSVPADATGKPILEQLRQRMAENMKRAKPSVIILGHEKDVEAPEPEEAQETPDPVASAPVEPAVEPAQTANTALYPDDIADAMRFVSLRLKEKPQPAYVEALRDLKYLRKAGITRVGYSSDTPDQELLENITKLRTAVEENSEAIPPSRTAEYETFLGNALKRKTADKQTPHKAVIELPYEAQAEELPITAELPASPPVVVTASPVVEEPSQPAVVSVAEPTAQETSAHMPEALAALPETPHSAISSAVPPVVELTGPESPVAEPVVPEPATSSPAVSTGKRTAKGVLRDWYHAASAIFSRFKQNSAQALSRIKTYGQTYWQAAKQNAYSATGKARRIGKVAANNSRSALASLKNWKIHAAALCRCAVAYAKQNCWELAVGGVAGSASRIAIQFSIASAITMPPAWLAVSAAIATGALAGGISGLARATW